MTKNNSESCNKKQQKQYFDKTNLLFKSDMCDDFYDVFEVYWIALLVPGVTVGYDHISTCQISTPQPVGSMAGSWIWIFLRYFKHNRADGLNWNLSSIFAHFSECANAMSPWHFQSNLIPTIRILIFYCTLIIYYASVFSPKFTNLLMDSQSKDVFTSLLYGCTYSGQSYQNEQALYLD